MTYSPTIHAELARDPNWWSRNGGGYHNGTNPNSCLDDDGYDEFGYSGEYGDGPDRADNFPDDYHIDGYTNALYQLTLREWADGINDYA